MAFQIKSDRTDEPLRELTALTGESLTAAVTESLRERLERERRKRATDPDADPLDAAIARFRAVVNAPAGRSGGDPLGDDEHGLPT